MAVVDEARKMLEKRLGELDSERRMIEQALRSLGGRVDGRRPAAGPKRRRRRQNAKRSQGTRAPRGQRADQVLAILQKNPNYRPRDIAGELAISPAQASNLLRKLRDEKRVVRTAKGGYKVRAA